MEERNTIQDRGVRRRALIVLAACVLVGIGVVAFWPREREPEYNGKKLSEWLEICRRPGSYSERAAAEAAVRKIGTNALPWLVRWLHSDMPDWRYKLFQTKYSAYLPQFGRYFVVKPIIEIRHAEIGFEVLGPMAGPAAPEVAQGLDNWPKLSAIETLAALRILGANALKPLYAVATNRAKPLALRREAMNSIGMRQLGRNEEWIVQTIIPYLADEEMAEPTARALGNLGMVPSVSVPALLQATDSKNPEVRLWAVISLGQFHNEAEQAIPELNARALLDSDPRVRGEATNALAKIVPDMFITNGVKEF